METIVIRDGKSPLKDNVNAYNVTKRESFEVQKRELERIIEYWGTYIEMMSSNSEIMEHNMSILSQIAMFRNSVKNVETIVYNLKLNLADSSLSVIYYYINDIGDRLNRMFDGIMYGIEESVHKAAGVVSLLKEEFPILMDEATSDFLSFRRSGNEINGESNSTGFDLETTLKNLKSSIDLFKFYGEIVSGKEIKMTQLTDMISALFGGVSMQALVEAGVTVAGFGYGISSIASGFSDWKQGQKLSGENPRLGAVYKEAGFNEIAMPIAGAVAGAVTSAAAGALAGSLALSWVPIVGPLLGASIGAVAGGIYGKYKKQVLINEYEAEMLAEAQAKYKSQIIKDALANDSFSDAQLSAIIYQEIRKDMSDRFGEVVLSASELDQMAAKLVYNGMGREFEMFSSAFVEAENALAQFNNTVYATEKALRLTGINKDLEKGDIEILETQTQQLVNTAYDTGNEQLYAAITSLDLLFGEYDNSSMIKWVLEAMGTRQSEIDLLQNKLDELFASTKKENGELVSQIELQSIIQEILTTTGDLAELVNGNFYSFQDSQVLALLDSSTEEKISLRSYESLLELLAKQSVEAKGMLGEAYIQALEFLSIDPEIYEAWAPLVRDLYQQQINGIDERIGGYQYGEIAYSYKDVIDEISLESISQCVNDTEKIAVVINEILTSGVDFLSLKTEEKMEMFGLSQDLFSGEFGETIIGFFDLIDSLFATLGDVLPNDIESSKELSGTSTLDYDIDSLTELATEFSASINGILDNAIDRLGKDLGTIVVPNIGQSILDQAGEFESYFSDLRSEAENYLKTVFASPFDITTSANVKVNLNYDITNPVLSLSGSGQVNFHGTNLSGMGAVNSANGRFVNGLQLSWLGEEGPEVVIPLSYSRRARGVDLWERAGQLLGVPGLHTNPGSSDANWSYDWMEGDQEQVNVNAFSFDPISLDKTQEKANVVIEKIVVENNFDMGSGDNVNSDQFMSSVRIHMGEIADELGGEIAESLEKVFSNMPLASVSS